MQNSSYIYIFFLNKKKMFLVRIGLRASDMHNSALPLSAILFRTVLTIFYTLSQNSHSFLKTLIFFLLKKEEEKNIFYSLFSKMGICRDLYSCFNPLVSVWTKLIEYTKTQRRRKNCYIGPDYIIVDLS